MPKNNIVVMISFIVCTHLLPTQALVTWKPANITMNSKDSNVGEGSVMVGLPLIWAPAHGQMVTDSRRQMTKAYYLLTWTGNKEIKDKSRGLAFEVS